MKGNKQTDIQQILFAYLKNNSFSNNSLVDILSDLLNISNDAAYRRLRGEKRLDIDELMKICIHFNISLDAFLGVKLQMLQFKYIPLDLSNQQVYSQYMKQLLLSFTVLSKEEANEVFFTAIDIPMFHFLPHTELTLFKVFSWSKSIGAFEGNYSDFCKLNKDDELLNIYKHLINIYNEIPSVEIWTEGTFDSILRLIDYSFECGYFASKEEALLICSQLLEMVTRINKWSVRGFKDELTGKVPYKLYLSDIEILNGAPLRYESRWLKKRDFSLHSE